jgi:hypothetical protein
MVGTLGGSPNPPAMNSGCKPPPFDANSWLM